MNESNKPYTVIKPSEIIPDYNSARRYEPIFRQLSRGLLFDRNQLLFTDDPDKTQKMVINYFLHVNSLSEGTRMSVLENLLIGASLSAEEFANSPELHVNLDGDISEIQSQDKSTPLEYCSGINQSRFERRTFREAVQFDIDHPEYANWVDIILKKIGSTYANTSNDQRDFLPFTWSLLSEKTFEYFEAREGRIIFVNKTRLNSQMQIQGLQRAHLDQKRYSENHSDYVNIIPNTVWVLPFEQYGRFHRAYLNAVSPSEYPHEVFWLHKPLNHWLEGLEELFKDIDEEDQRIGRNLIMSGFAKLRLEGELRMFERKLKRNKKEHGLERAMEMDNLSVEEAEFLLNLREFDPFNL